MYGNAIVFKRLPLGPGLFAHAATLVPLDVAKSGGQEPRAAEYARRAERQDKVGALNSREAP